MVVFFSFHFFLVFLRRNVTDACILFILLVSILLFSLFYFFLSLEKMGKKKKLAGWVNSDIWVLFFHFSSSLAKVVHHA